MSTFIRNKGADLRQFKAKGLIWSEVTSRGNKHACLRKRQNLQSAAKFLRICFLFQIFKGLKNNKDAMAGQRLHQLNLTLQQKSHGLFCPIMLLWLWWPCKFIACPSLLVRHVYFTHKDRLDPWRCCSWFSCQVVVIKKAFHPSLF